MANPIDITVTQQALKEMDALIAKVTTAREGFLSLGQSILDSSKNTSKISTPSGLNTNTNVNAKFNEEIKKTTAEIEKSNAIIAKAAEKSRLAELRLEQAREKASIAQEKRTQRETALAEKNANTYNKTQAQINRLTFAYNDLSLRKERYNNLSVNEEMRLSTLGKVTEKYNGILKTTDAQIGKNQRNVGNYASGYNALGNSINQLSREAPAFANSVNTGFMALSNNFPALFDAINGIRDKNKLLVAEGKPTVSVLKSIAGAMFSWQTLLSIGVTLLTLYGGKIVEFIGNAMKGKQAVQSLAENQKQLNEALKESSGSYAEQKVNIEVLYKTSNDLNKSYKDRKRAVDELQQLYPAYFGNLTDEAIMTGQAKDQYLLLSNAIVTVAKARASEEILQKRESERLVIEQEQIDKTMQKYKQLATAKGTTTYVSGGGSVAGAGTSSVQETAEQQRARLRREIQDLRNESITQRNAWAKEDSFFIEKIAQGNAIEQTLKPAEKARKEKIKKEKKARREDIEGLESHIKTVSVLIEEINTEIERLETEKIVANADELPAVNSQLEQLLTLKRQLNGIPTVDFTINVPVKAEDIEKVKELTQEVKSYLTSFENEFMSNSGLSETFQLLNGEIEDFGENFAVTFNAIAESAQEAFNFIANASQANFDNERKRIEDQQNIAISYAGGSAVAIAKINEDAEKRKKEVTNRENKAKQKQAIFNIAIDTAQAIIASVAKSPETFGLPFSAFAAAIGAVQIGLVASQKIPHYFDGGVHEQGGLAMINDAKGNNYVETVVTPDGKAKQYSGRDVVTNLPKGTEIFTPEQWHEKQILAMMQSNGINMTANYNKSNGMTANQMDAVLGKHFSNIKTHNTTFDKNGFKSYLQNGNSRTIMNQNRVSGSGISV